MVVGMNVYVLFTVLSFYCYMIRYFFLLLKIIKKSQSFTHILDIVWRWWRCILNPLNPRRLQLTAALFGRANAKLEGRRYAQNLLRMKSTHSTLVFYHGIATEKFHEKSVWKKQEIRYMPYRFFCFSFLRQRVPVPRWNTTLFLENTKTYTVYKNRQFSINTLIEFIVRFDYECVQRKNV